MLEKWNLKDESTVLETPPFNVLLRQFIKPEEETVVDTYVLKYPDWVNVIGITPEKKILLIRQFRFGSQNIELEIPGGCIDPGEDPLEGARRELEEETGYVADEFIPIGQVDANPAVQTNKCYTFLAKNIMPKGKLNLDPNEIISMEFAGVDQVKEYIKSGQITNTYIIAAFFWYFFIL